MKLKHLFAAVLLFGSTAAHAAVVNCSQTCVTTQTTWSSTQTAGLSEQPATNTDSGSGADLPYKNRVTAPTDEQQTYTGSASSFIAGANQVISLQAAWQREYLQRQHRLRIRVRVFDLWLYHRGPRRPDHWRCSDLRGSWSDEFRWRPR